MNYTVEELNDCTKKLVFNFEDIDLTDQIDVAIKEKQKTANLKGFRKGKAPRSMVQQVYGPQIESEALNRFILTEFQKAIIEEKIQALGYPSFANTKFENEKKSLSFEAVVETFPKFEVKDYSGLSFTKDSDVVSDEEYQNIEKSFLESKATMTPLEGDNAVVAKGHFVTFNFEGEKPDGERPDNMKAQDYQLEIGSGQFIPGFEEQMEGMKLSEKKTLEVTFPEDYHDEGLKGAKCKFDVEILEIKSKEYPEFTDELAKEFQFESYEDFKTKNTERLKTQKTRDVQRKLHQEVLEALVKENNFAIPSALLEQQKQSVRQELTGTLKQQGFNDDMVKTYFEKWDSDVASRAEFQVRSGLILDAIAKAENVETTDADLDAKVEEIKATSDLGEEEIRKFYLDNPQTKTNLQYAIREEKTFEKILEKVKITQA